MTSPNSGTVARHGTEGFINAYDDIDAMCQSVRLLAEDPDLRLSMGEAARRRAAEFNLDWYSREIANVLHRARQPQGSSAATQATDVALSR